MNIIDHLSLEAKSELEQYTNNNLGVICVDHPDRSKEVNEVAFGKLFRRASNYGRYYLREYKDGEVVRSSLLLNNGINDDSGNLFGFLRKQSANLGSSSFLYKPYDRLDRFDYYNVLNTTPVDFRAEDASIKYELVGDYVKLESLRSFHARFTREW